MRLREAIKLKTGDEVKVKKSRNFYRHLLPVGTVCKVIGIEVALVEAEGWSPGYPTIFVVKNAPMVKQFLHHTDIVKWDK